MPEDILVYYIVDATIVNAQCSVKWSVNTTVHASYVRNFKDRYGHIGLLQCWFYYILCLETEVIKLVCSRTDNLVGICSKINAVVPIGLMPRVCYCNKIHKKIVAKCIFSLNSKWFRQTYTTHPFCINLCYNLKCGLTVRIKNNQSIEDFYQQDLKLYLLRYLPLLFIVLLTVYYVACMSKYQCLFSHTQVYSAYLKICSS